jgi:phosphoribosylaminoimidazole-succinocarboxamide synthase
VIARDVGYIQKEEFDKIAQQTVKVAKILRGLIKKTGLMIQNSRF